MDTTIKDKQINVKVNSHSYEDAEKVFQSLGLDTTAVINQLIKYVAVKKELPFKSEEEELREELIEQLSQRFDSNLDEMEKEGGIGLEEARRRLA